MPLLNCLMYGQFEANTSIATALTGFAGEVCHSQFCYGSVIK